MRKASECFADALLAGSPAASAQAWLWTDFARAMQSALRDELGRATGTVSEVEPGSTSAGGACDQLRGWTDELAEAEAAADVAMMLGDTMRAPAVRTRLASTVRRLDATRQQCGATVDNSTYIGSAASRAAAQVSWAVAAVAAGAPRHAGQAVELARAYCGGIDASVDCDFSDGATSRAVRSALLALRICGVAVLRRAWAPAELSAVAAAQRANFERSQLEAGAVERWRGRFESQLPLQPPFDDTRLARNPGLLAVVLAVGETVISLTSPLHPC